MSVGIIVNSVGTARPQMAVAVAHGLGLPVDRTLKAIYRAPSLLVGSIEDTLASKLSVLLRETGLETEIIHGSPALVPTVLHDVAVRITDPSALDETLAVVADFCACDTTRALALLTTPPGIVLGGVSTSTVEALRRNLPAEGTRVAASRTDQARFATFAISSSRTLAAQIDMAIGAEAQTVGEMEGLNTVGFEAAQRLWSRFGRTGALRLLNADFMTFDLWLDGVMDGMVPDISVLGAVAGIPPEHRPAVVEAAPLILERDLDYGRLQEVLPMCAAAGLKARAELTTFARAAVQIERGDAALAHPVMALFGMPPPGRLPVVTAPMPLAKARLLIGALTRAGLRSDLAENPGG